MASVAFGVSSKMNNLKLKAQLKESFLRKLKTLSPKARVAILEAALEAKHDNKAIVASGVKRRHLIVSRN